MTDIFISYRAKDQDYASIIDLILRTEFDDKEIFFASESIEGGTKWEPQIDEAIAKCTLVLVVIAENWWSNLWNEVDEIELLKDGENKDWVIYEIHKALKLGRRILPVAKSRALSPEKRPSLPSVIRGLSEIQTTLFRTEAKTLDKPSLLRAVHAHFDKVDVFPDSDEVVDAENEVEEVSSHPQRISDEEDDDILSDISLEEDAREVDAPIERQQKRGCFRLEVQIIVALIGLIGLILTNYDSISNYLQDLGGMFGETSTSSVAIVAQDGVTTWNRAGRNRTQVAELNQYTRLDILGISEDERYYYVRLPDDSEAWITVSSANLNFEGDIPNFPVIDVTATAVSDFQTREANSLATIAFGETATAQYTPPTMTHTPSDTPTSTDTPTNTPTDTPTLTFTPTPTPSNTPTTTLTPSLTFTPTPTPTHTPSNDDLTATATMVVLLDTTVPCGNMYCQREFYTRADVSNGANLSWESAMDYCGGLGGQLLNQTQWHILSELSASDTSIVLGYNYGELLCDGTTVQCNPPTTFNQSYVYFPDNQGQSERTIEGFDATMIALESNPSISLGASFRCAFPIP